MPSFAEAISDWFFLMFSGCYWPASAKSASRHDSKTELKMQLQITAASLLGCQHICRKGPPVATLQQKAAAIQSNNWKATDTSWVTHCCYCCHSVAKLTAITCSPFSALFGSFRPRLRVGLSETTVSKQKPLCFQDGRCWGRNLYQDFKWASSGVAFWQDKHHLFQKYNSLSAAASYIDPARLASGGARLGRRKCRKAATGCGQRRLQSELNLGLKQQHGVSALLE